MMKLFNHTKRPYEKWGEYEESFNWDNLEESEESFEYDASAEEEGRYYADGEYGTGEFEGEYDTEETNGTYYSKATEDGTYVEEAEGEYYEEETESGYYGEAEDEYYAEEAENAYDTEEADSEYYDEESGDSYYSEVTEDGTYVEEAEDGYYEEENEGGYYEEAEGGYYTEEGEYYAEETEGGYYTEEGEYYAEETEGEYYAEEDEEAYTISMTVGQKETRTKEPDNVLAALWMKFMQMSSMDRIVTTTGVLVLVMALITGSVYFAARINDNRAIDFTTVGTQLEGIDLIGEQGLLAMTDAHKARIAAAAALEEEKNNSGGSQGYNENDYNTYVNVGIDLVSVQKDLKIKFTNQKNNKLVSNVPFSVTVTNASGKLATWMDDDMDGIIYKKDLPAGSYKVKVDPITDTKYEKYTLPTDTRTVEVKDKIEYNKIDVSNEIKTEAEVNVNLEDTKVNETVVESKLEDTVKWVESTSTANTYIEVAKNKIPDPLTLVTRGAFQRMALQAGISQSSGTLSVGATLNLSAQITGEGETATNIKWTSSNPSVATVNENGTTVTVTAVGVGQASISYTYDTQVVSGGDAIAGATGVTGSTCMINVVEAADPVGTVAVNPTSVTIAKGATAASQATSTGFAAGKTLTYSVHSDRTDIATAAVDAAGKVTVTGVAVGDAVVTVNVNYQDKPAANPATATIAVKVTEAPATISLDKTAETVYIGDPVTINASIANATTDNAVTAESSDTGVATVEVSGRAVKITGVNAGSATITVKYAENGAEIKATCAVTVKNHPKNDTGTKLKDTDGRQLYVIEENTYREATYADYYKASQFFVKGDVKYTGWQTLDGKVYFFDASGNKVTGEQVIQGAKYNFASDGSLVTGSGTMGIDVSKWNGNIDWNAVKNSGVSYVIIRCGYRGSSQGALIEDPKFESNIKGATAAGLKVGVYFFTQAVDEVEAVEEASMVLELVEDYKISYPIFLDVEASGGRADKISSATRTAVCKAFCNTIQKAGYTAGIYANKTWLNTKMDAGQLGSYKIWLAQYAAAPTYTGRYDLWQYSSTGRISGISGDVDLNISYLGY